MRDNTAERKGFRIRCPAAFVAALSMVVLSGTAYGQKAWLDLRPLSGVSANGAHTTSGWCGNVVDGTPCTSHAACAGDLNGEQCYQRITLFSDDQEVYFEAWISNWASFPNRTCWSPIGPQDTGNPCNGGNDCTGDEICGGSILTYTVGLDCSGYDNGTAVLDVPLSGVPCGIFTPFPPDGFCAGLDANNLDWIHATAAGTIAGCGVSSLCPNGEQSVPWFQCGSVVASGIGVDGTLNSEAYLATYAVRVPAGGTGTWTLFLEDDQDDPSNVLMKHDAFLQDAYFVDFNIPLTITVVTGLGRCCGHPGGAFGCVDGITGEECLDGGGVQFRESQSCSGGDPDGDGLDEACDNCSLFNPDQTDCEPNGIGDVCDIANCTGELACSDCNNNGIPDGCEAEDCNANGVLDECDIAGGTSPDCNGNSLPDECELASNDCNANGVPDECDIAGGTSPDCNGNGLPDECEFASNDCNTNGVPDECDIAGGTSLDCNGNGLPDECDLVFNDCNTNGVPDECDIASGISQDCGPNGVPDECDPDCNNTGTPDECEQFDDCNNNGIPDECDPDCNANGLPDDCDIANGTSQDCGVNGVPDECEPDCNANGIPDDCDILGGTSQDCGPNGIPDECEPDCNNNGVPDACEVGTPHPEDVLGITTCLLDTDCPNEAYCIPDARTGFPGTCYVPKNRHLSVAPNAVNNFPTARRVSVVTFERSCGGGGNMPCTTNAQCTGNPDGATCDDVRVGSQVLGWFGQPNTEGYVTVVDEASRHYTIWTGLSFATECGVNEHCPVGAHCDVGHVGSSDVCLWNADDTQVPTSLVHLTGCHISPKKRDIRPGVAENSAANYYLIETIAQSADITEPCNYSVPLELRTVEVWGDMTGGTLNNVALPPDNAPSFLEILQQVNHFKHKGPATVPWLDLHPQEPDHDVRFLDMLEAVQAFKDKPYPYDDPCTCAGLPPCN